MNKYLVERAIIANRPGEPFVLVERTDEDEIDSLGTLDWQADTEAPTWDEAEGWATALGLQESRAAKTDEIKAALVVTDLWKLRHVEDGVSLTDARRAYIAELRGLLADASTSADPDSIELPAEPSFP